MGGVSVGAVVGSGGSAVGGRDVEVGAGETARVVGEGCASVGVSIRAGGWQAVDINTSNGVSRMV